jgi:hypothetical protein
MASSYARRAAAPTSAVKPAPKFGSAYAIFRRRAQSPPSSGGAGAGLGVGAGVGDGDGVGVGVGGIVGIGGGVGIGVGEGGSCAGAEARTIGS